MKLLLKLFRKANDKQVVRDRLIKLLEVDRAERTTFEEKPGH